MAEAEEPDEEVRLAMRAARIWGENPFSPERMAEESSVKPQERTYIDNQRYRRLRDYEEENQP